MKKFTLIMLLTLMSILVACSNTQETQNPTDDTTNEETIDKKDLPKPGDPDFIGPVRDEDIEKAQNK